MMILKFIYKHKLFNSVADSLTNIKICTYFFLRIMYLLKCQKTIFYKQIIFEFDSLENF